MTVHTGSYHRQQTLVERPSRWSRSLRLLNRLVRNPGALAGAVILLTLILASLLAPALTSFHWKDTSVGPRLAPPSEQHLFGTDIFGRDIFSRMLHGGRLSLSVGISTVLFSMIIGSLFGILIAYFGGRLDHAGVMAIDVMLGFPPIVLAILIVAVIGVGLPNVVLAVGIAGMPRFARVVRGTALSVTARPFFEGAKAAGASHGRIIFRHLLPNVFSTIVILGTLNLGGAIISASSLSFLGLGAQPPTPEWGAMLNDSREYMRHAPWTMIFPGVALFLSVMSVNLLGDWLRDVLDPRSLSDKR